MPSPSVSEDFVRVLDFDITPADFLVPALRFFDPDLLCFVLARLAQARKEGLSQSGSSLLWELESCRFEVFQSLHELQDSTPGFLAYPA